MSKPRSIFEEVGSDDKVTPVATGVIDRKAQGARGALRIWLIGLFVLVAVMIAVGGLTRLTDSGLSITEWNLVMGSVPPMNEAAWLSEFAKYQQTTEYQVQNFAMDLVDFKSIYWWEWGHRQLGRFIGTYWILGLLGFLAFRKIPTGWSKRLLIPGVLIGLQGAIGWWMVSSGLKDGMLDVASYRLATHLGLAFIILGFVTWFILRLPHTEAALIPARRLSNRKLFSMSTGLMHFAFLQILLGALVAGIDAGRGFTTWPLMNGGIFPPEPFKLDPVWRNFFENPGLVQFVHRTSGYLLAIFGLIVWLRARKAPQKQTRRAFHLVMAVMALQIFIGVLTVLNGAMMHVAITHQIIGMALWVVVIRARFNALYPTSDTLKA